MVDVFITWVVCDTYVKTRKKYTLNMCSLIEVNSILMKL